MRDGSSEGNVPHALAANSRAGYFNAALITDDTFVTGIFVLTTITLPVSLGSKDGFTEQAIFFRSKTAVVDGFRLEYLAI
jgi:hypothetical protein